MKCGLDGGMLFIRLTALPNTDENVEQRKLQRSEFHWRKLEMNLNKVGVGEGEAKERVIELKIVNDYCK